VLEGCIIGNRCVWDMLYTALPVLTEKSDHKKRIHIREVADSDVSTSGNQATKHGIMPACGCTEQRRVDAVVHGVHVGTLPDEMAGHIQMTPQSGPVQG